MKRFCQYYRASDISRSRGAAKSCEIHKNTTKTAKFGRNLIKYMSVQHIWTYFSYRGYLLAVNLQISLRTSSLKRANKVPKLPGVDYVVKNWALAIMLKALPLVPGGAGSEVWNRVYMIAPVKKSGRVRLSTVFLQNKYGGEYRHGRTTRFCSVWVFPRPNIKKRFSDFRATSLVFISHIFPPTGVLRTLFLILNTCY